MNLFSFFSKIFFSIKQRFAALSTELKIAVHLGVQIVENIKQFTDSPVLDILTAIIPSSIDDKVKDILRQEIPIILVKLKLADICSGLTDPTEITSCAIKVLQSLDDNIKSSFLHTLSVMIAQLASDKKLSWSDGVYIVEWYYHNQFKTSS